ncbi:MAG: aminoglycoside phosphotransferase family protein [Chloroflexi bacterium]|nr:aminoglycoside phosphotransferase family protein [Chloroflexota bacterium]
MITSATDLTKDWLEEILATKIKQFSQYQNPAFNSSVTHLDIIYADSAPALPTKLLLKLNQEHDGQNEIQFYRFAQKMNLPMLPQRFGMAYDPHSGGSFLVLEDISETHTPPVTREQLRNVKGVPPIHQMESIMDCMAQFHAAFWEHPQSGTVPDTTEVRWWYRDEQFHAKHIERRTHEWTKFTEMFHAEVPSEWLNLGTEVLARLPQLFATHIEPRLASRQSMTMSQGDCYLSQFLIPRQGLGQAYLIDFQDACVNLPAYDLVYMLATFWSREQRALHEENLLRRYQDELNGRGVPYSWDMLCTDYRVSLNYMFFDAVWNATSGSSTDYWKPKMKCLFEAYQDWH